MTAYRGRSAGCPCMELRGEQSFLTAPQKSAEGIVPRMLVGRPERKRSRRLQWSGEMAPGEAWDRVFDAWGELATGATGEDAAVEVSIRPRLHLPNRRRRDPSVRWCGRGEAVRPLPIPNRLTKRPNHLGSCGSIESWNEERAPNGFWHRHVSRHAGISAS